MYYDGYGVAKSSELAFEWMTKAAEQDYIEAQLRLINMHIRDVDNPESEDLAMMWLQRAHELDPEKIEELMKSG